MASYDTHTWTLAAGHVNVLHTHRPSASLFQSQSPIDYCWLIPCLYPCVCLVKSRQTVCLVGFVRFRALTLPGQLKHFTLQATLSRVSHPLNLPRNVNALCTMLKCVCVFVCSSNVALCAIRVNRTQ